MTPMQQKRRSMTREMRVYKNVDLLQIFIKQFKNIVLRSKIDKYNYWIFKHNFL